MIFSLFLSHNKCKIPILKFPSFKITYIIKIFVNVAVKVKISNRHQHAYCYDKWLVSHYYFGQVYCSNYMGCIRTNTREHCNQLKRSMLKNNKNMFFIYTNRISKYIKKLYVDLAIHLKNCNKTKSKFIVLYFTNSDLFKKKFVLKLTKTNFCEL